MNRRTFSKAAASVIAVSAFPNDVLANLNCGPIQPTDVRYCSAGIDSTVATRIAKVQKNTQWCWAASIEMLFEYYGFIVPQEQIVGETWGHIVNMPATDLQIMKGLNRSWQDKSGKIFRSSSSKVSIGSAAQNLARNTPLIICTTGHAMVLTALEYFTDKFEHGDVKNAIVMDPWETNGRRSLTAPEWYSTNLLAKVVCTKA